MSFSVIFLPPSPLDTWTPVAAEDLIDPEEDYETLVIKACGALAQAGGSSFLITGFGAEPWPLDVAYDLSAFMEQFPDLLDGVRDRQEVAIDLYPQGLERELVFTPAGDQVTIRCRSRTGWRPGPEMESVPHLDLVPMLTKLAENFATGLKIIGSDFAGVEPFAHWLDGHWPGVA